MAYHPGESVLCFMEVTDPETGVFTDPATSMLITITDNRNGIEVDGVEMVKDSVGHYHYDWNTSEDALSGIYTISYKAVDDTRISIALDRVEIIQYVPT